MLLTGAKKGKLWKVKLALSLGANIEERNESGQTAFILAAKHYNSAVINYLFSKGADVEARDNMGQTAIFYSREEQITQILINNGAKINIRDRDGCTPLMVAIGNYTLSSGNSHIEYLVEQGADVNAKNNNGETALILLAKRGRHTDIGLLMNESTDSPMGCVSDPPFKCFEILISKGANLNAKSNDGTTVLMSATQDDNSKLVKFLISKGADVMSKDNNGNTALMKAIINCRSVHKEFFVQLYVSCGVDVNARNNNGDTALLLEAARKYPDNIFNFLASIGADVNVQNKQGKTALMLLYRNNNGATKAFDYLLSVCKNIDAKDAKSYTLLMHTAMDCNLEMIEKLAVAGADLNITDNEGNTAVLLVAKGRKNEAD